VQADTIVPNPANPQDLNRYTYVRNNPLRYVDPTGHVKQEEVRDATDVISTLWELYTILIQIDFGWVPLPAPAPGEPSQRWDEGAWELSELNTVLEAAGDVAWVMGGSAEFRSIFGETQFIKGWTLGNAGLTWTEDLIALGDNPKKWTVVHELAHSWDKSTGGQLSRGLEAFTGGKTTGWLFWQAYDPGGVPPKGADADFNRSEDFAESLTTFIYPGEAQAFIQDRFRNSPRFHYESYYKLPRASYIAMQINMDPQEFIFWRKAW
jgi:hypothetical protein